MRPHRRIRDRHVPGHHLARLPPAPLTVRSLAHVILAHVIDGGIVIHTVILSGSRRQRITAQVNRIVAESPSDSDLRFARRCIAQGREAAPEVSTVLDVYPDTALLVTGLPCFSDVTRTKILTMLLADCAGRLTGYAAFNGSLVTNIVHNDLPSVGDRSRPAYVVLVAHRATGAAPRTLLAAADDDAHPLRKGEALVIPHDQSLHGDEQRQRGNDRVVLRGHTLAKGVRKP